MWGKECGFARARADVRRAKEPDRHSRHVPARVPCPVKLERVAPDYGYQVHIAWTRPSRTKRSSTKDHHMTQKVGFT